MSVRRGPSAGYDGVVLAAPFTLVPVRHSPKPAEQLLAEVLKGVLAAARLAPRELDGLSVASFTLAPGGAASFAAHLGLTFGYLDQPQMGGASAIAAVRRAARMVAAGDVDRVAVIAADKNERDTFPDLIQTFSAFARDAVWPYGAGGPNAVFALITDHYMRTFGATRDDFGRVAVAQRANAKGIPHAIFHDRSLSLGEYLAARPIAAPLCLYDCVMPVAGGEGCLVMREADAQAAGLAYAHLLATLERHNAFAHDAVHYRAGWAVERDAFWARAGCRPDAVDCVETYDDYPVMCLIQLEDLGFCGKGEAPSLVRQADLTRSGTLPHNTSGGQLSAGQAGAAGGHLGLVEALRQVTRQAPGWQVEGADLALVSGYGMATYDRGVCATAALLAGGRRA